MTIDSDYSANKISKRFHNILIKCPCKRSKIFQIYFQWKWISFDGRLMNIHFKSYDLNSSSLHSVSNSSKMNDASFSDSWLKKQCTNRAEPSRAVPSENERNRANTVAATSFDMSHVKVTFIASTSRNTLI